MDLVSELGLALHGRGAPADVQPQHHERASEEVLPVGRIHPPRGDLEGDPRIAMADSSHASSRGPRTVAIAASVVTRVPTGMPIWTPREPRPTAVRARASCGPSQPR